MLMGPYKNAHGRTKRNAFHFCFYGSYLRYFRVTVYAEDGPSWFGLDAVGRFKQRLACVLRVNMRRCRLLFCCSCGFARFSRAPPLR